MFARAYPMYAEFLIPKEMEILLCMKGLNSNFCFGCKASSSLIPQKSCSMLKPSVVENTFDKEEALANEGLKFRTTISNLGNNFFLIACCFRVDASEKNFTAAFVPLKLIL